MSASQQSLQIVPPSSARKVDQADVWAYESRASMGRAAAETIAAKIRELANIKSEIRMIFAAAPSQTEVLSLLTAQDDLPWSKITAFHMDDYLDLPADAPQRFANWLDRHLFSKVSLGAVHRIPATGDAEEICVDYAAKLSEAPIDIVCLGIGVNGHIAFNDPPVADFADPRDVKPVILDQICRQQQVDDDCFDQFSDVPERAITLTIPRLIAADALYCVVPGAQKKQAVKAALEGEVTPDCPASILRLHPNCTMFLDAESDPNG